jgi:hypothetical protein
MTRVSRPWSSGVPFAVLFALVAGGCGSDAIRSPLAPADAPFAAKATTSVSVKATNPGFGDQGQINETVTITGSGFKGPANAAWLRNGVVDPTITVLSTQVTSSTTAVAVISIAANSPLDFRDVQITNFDRTQGIGAAVFEVTQAQIIPGAGPARGVNDNGQVTGSLLSGGTFYYDISSGLFQTVSPAAGTGYEINPPGSAIAGGSINGSAGFPVLYIRSGPPGTAWTPTLLPVDPKAIGGAADAMVSDPLTGQVTMLGGLEERPIVHGAACSNAVIWTWQSSTDTWARTLLPSSNGACQTGIRPRGLSANGTAVGSVDNVAAVWTPNGSGGYTLTLLNGAYANGIDGSASMIVGDKSVSKNLAAIYWLSSGGAWGNAVAFPGGCGHSRDVANASGRVTLYACTFGSNSVQYAAYIDAPYTTPMKLGGVGGHNDNLVTGISPSGAYMVGSGFTSGGNQVGVYWRP